MGYGVGPKSRGRGLFSLALACRPYGVNVMSQRTKTLTFGPSYINARMARWDMKTKENSPAHTSSDIRYILALPLEHYLFRLSKVCLG